MAKSLRQIECGRQGGHTTQEHHLPLFCYGVTKQAHIQQRTQQSGKNICYADNHCSNKVQNGGSAKVASMKVGGPVHVSKLVAGGGSGCQSIREARAQGSMLAAVMYVRMVAGQTA